MSRLGANIVEPGLIQHYVLDEYLEFGEIDGGISERCKSIQTALTQKDIIEFNAVPNILECMCGNSLGFARQGCFQL